MNHNYKNCQDTRTETRACAKPAAFLKNLCRIRLKICRNGLQKLNLPLLLCVAVGLINLPLTLLAAIAGVLCDYTWQVDMNGITF